ncbi:FtsW/RodA/SpoVE family cell cycle protein [Sphingomonas sp. LY160]|uniref:FtsW/RodA/SpoVE family cell cycle protein n=1 Tax=Sphingomonas sp. LY160 TaxID=3095342 RepID=UPI002ADEAE21|nr:FtsW/RodA/SpoVE family cell cycle protein [Sphingomonas sp. LY160]MEA1072913.1 FtsW/RodA/SpoVE family cell cycle protein [Sphingomonas sp. LY160]
MSRAGSASLALGTCAVAAGAAFLWDVGALPGMASRNAAAFVVGLALGWGSHALARRHWGAAALFALGTVVLALVLLFGAEVDGVRRWLPLGPFDVQPALMLVPLLLAIAASREGRHWRALILLPMALVALQPDAATLAALAAGMVALMVHASVHSRRGWSRRRTSIAVGALFVTVVGIVVAGIRTPPPVAFVEGTIEIARLSGTPAILLHLAAVALMIAALAASGEADGIALAAYFTVAAVVAAFWAFPMPVAGAAPSHLVGFGLALGWVATGRRRAAPFGPSS